MSDEQNVWRDAKSMGEYRPLPSQACADELSAAVIRDYGDRRDATARSEGHAAGYQQAIADVVEWLGDSLTLTVPLGVGMADGAASAQRQIIEGITRRFGKDV